VCARQTKELEQLRRMLDDSHTMLEQVRDALEAERSERVRLVGVLEHEQQRTQLLLDVLRHFKEKLQGLAPGVLASGELKPGADLKAFVASQLGTPEAHAFSALALVGDTPQLRLSPSAKHGEAAPARRPCARRGLGAWSSSASDGASTMWPETGHSAAFAFRPGSAGALLRPAASPLSSSCGSAPEGHRPRSR